MERLHQKKNVLREGKTLFKGKDGTEYCTKGREWKGEMKESLLKIEGNDLCWEINSSKGVGNNRNLKLK